MSLTAYSPWRGRLARPGAAGCRRKRPGAAREKADHRRELLELLAAQKRTNKLLQAIIYGGMGFVLGLIAMQLLVRVQLF